MNNWNNFNMILLKINFYLHKGIFTIYIMYIVYVQSFVYVFYAFFVSLFLVLLMWFFPLLHIHVVLFEINRDAVCKWYLVIMLPWLKLIWGSALMYSSMCKSNVLFILFTLFCFVFVNIIRWYSHTLKKKKKKVLSSFQ